MTGNLLMPLILLLFLFKIVSSRFASPSSQECCSTSNCIDYRGAIATTRSGKTCQAWSSRWPHDHFLTEDFLSGRGLEGNSCRNPGGPYITLEDTAWCFTTDRRTRWELCSVPTCHPAIRPAFIRSPTCNYKLFHEPKTWFDARDFCRDQGMHLAMPKSDQQQNALTQQFRHLPRYWIGVYASTSSGDDPNDRSILTRWRHTGDYTYVKTFYWRDPNYTYVTPPFSHSFPPGSDYICVVIDNAYSEDFLHNAQVHGNWAHRRGTEEPHRGCLEKLPFVCQECPGWYGEYYGEPTRPSIKA